MKKIILAFAMLVVTLSVSCQTGTGWKQITTKENFVTSVNFAGTVMMGGVTITPTAAKFNFLSNVTSDIQAQINAKQATLVSGTNIKTINSTSLLGSGDMVIGSGGTMVYPGAGIPLSTGSAWGTSITNNSANWNTAYSWGNPSGVYLPIAGTAAKATILATARTINGVSFDGSANITVPSNITAGTSGNLMISNGTIWTSAVAPTWNQNTTGSAAKLTTARTINGVSFDGTANVSVPSNITASTAGNVMTSTGSVWSSAAPVITLTNAVTLTNKTLTSPKLNEDVALTSTSTDLNALHSSGATTTLDISAVSTVPVISSAAGDTSLAPIPGKVGNIYINTTGGNVYISIKAVRHNGWVKVN
jgi:hypothetical protein